MICGIYILYFENTEKVYIGKSNNIDRRFSQHLRSMEKGTSATKLQDAYILYGIPYLNIYKECTEEELDNIEKQAILEYDSIYNGFNTIMPYEYYSSEELLKRSKYPADVYMDILRMLASSQYISCENIGNILKVSSSIVRNISRGCSHKWLEYVLPTEYSIVKDKYLNRVPGNSAVDRGIKYNDIIDPYGNIYSITSLTEFALLHGLNKSNLCLLLKGKYKTHKGWRLKIDSI